MSVTRSIRDLRRADAEKRQEAYDKLTLQQKLDALPKNGAKKQRAKLEALLAKQNKPQEVVVQTDEQPVKTYQKKAKD